MVEEVRLELIGILNKMENLYIKLENLRNADNDIRNNIEHLELLISEIEDEIEKSNPEGLERKRNEFLENKKNSWQKIDYSAIANEEQRKRLNDAMEEYDEYDNNLLENGDEITDTEMEFQKLRELYESKKSKYYSKYEGICTHPLCYNLGYYIGRISSGMLVPIEQAKYSIEVCLECGRRLSTYREGRKKSNPNWYQPKYEVIKYKDGQARNELMREFKDIYLYHPEAIATETIKEYVRTNSK